jgi:cyanophycinase
VHVACREVPPAVLCRGDDKMRAMLPRTHPLLFVLLLLLAHAGARAQGTVVAIGGALQDDNALVWQRLVQLVQPTPTAAGGKDDEACFHVITLASADAEASAARVVANLARHGGRGVPLPRPQDEPAPIGRCRGIYMTGGAQARLLDALLGTPALRAMQRLLARGGVIAGSSAGAAVLSRHVFRDAPDVLAVMKGRLREGTEWGAGFGFAPSEVIVDQHAVRRGRMGRLLPLLQATGTPLGVAVEEDSAALFSGGRIEVLGGRGVLLADLTQATPRAAPPFGLSSGTLHWLESGDRFDIATRQVQPAARKLAGTRLEPLSPQHRGYHRGPWASNDILGEGQLVVALQRLVDGDRTELLGLAFAARPTADDPAPALGFEWRLRADAATRGWLLTQPDAYTVSGVRFDIVPVLLPQPLIRPYTP